MLDTVQRWLASAVTALTVLGGTVIVTVLVLGVFYRYVLHNALSWTDEVAMLSFSWTVLLAAALLVQESGHVRVELIESALPEWGLAILRRLIQLLVLATGAYMVWTGWDFMMMTVGQTAPATRYPIWVRNLALPVSGVLIVFFSLLQLSRPAPADDDAGPEGSPPPS